VYFVNFFKKHYYYDYLNVHSLIITGEHMHTASKQWHNAPQLVKYPRCFVAGQTDPSLQGHAYRIEFASAPFEKALIIINL